MTEAEWLAESELRWEASFDIWELDYFLGRFWKSKSDRKWRLFACASCRRALLLFRDPRTRVMVEFAERFVDDLLTETELLHAAEQAEKAHDRPDLREPYWSNPEARAATGLGQVGTRFSPLMVADACFTLLAGSPSSEYSEEAAGKLLCDTVRDILGNPFRPVAFDPQWRSADAVSLARGIHEERAFDRLPLLADVLMDAGCADEQVLGHCRSEGPHVRGCWVVDLVLDKK
jgi:hypothetical protein